jgi:hypothetical protein
MSGNEWRDWPAAMKRSYVWGVIDTWSNIPEVPRFVNERRSYPTPSARLADCLGKSMTYYQVYVLVEKFMADNPSQRHADMTRIIWAVVNKACIRMKETKSAASAHSMGDSIPSN